MTTIVLYVLLKQVKNKVELRAFIVIIDCRFIWLNVVEDELLVCFKSIWEV